MNVDDEKDHAKHIKDDVDYQQENEAVASRQPPGLSYWPICLALGMLLMAIGVVSTLVFTVLGILILLGSIAGWAEENHREQEPES